MAVDVDAGRKQNCWRPRAVQQSAPRSSTATTRPATLCAAAQISEDYADAAMREFLVESLRAIPPTPGAVSSAVLREAVAARVPTSYLTICGQHDDQRPERAPGTLSTPVGRRSWRRCCTSPTDRGLRRGRRSGRPGLVRSGWVVAPRSWLERQLRCRPVVSRLSEIVSCQRAARSRDRGPGHGNPMNRGRVVSASRATRAARQLRQAAEGQQRCQRVSDGAPLLDQCPIPCGTAWHSTAAK